MDLGFAEDCQEKWRLFNNYFPCKLGGPPAWLRLNPIPSFEDLKCHGCLKACTFLLQLYSPGDDDDGEDGDGGNDQEDNTRHRIDSRVTSSDEANCHQTFHRTIFVFVCAAKSCTNRSVKCFRSQLPRKNDFYPNDPPNYNKFEGLTNTSTFSIVASHSKVCFVCHCAAEKVCSQCKRYSYCSKDHQAMHWRGGHKLECLNKADNASNSGSTLNNYFFKEYEVVMESEEPSDAKPKSEKEILQEYEQFTSQASKPGGSLGKATQADWDSAKEVKVADKAFMAFRERIANAPDQIIRYEKGGKPLLVSDETKPPTSIACCELCGGEREFEFQVLSQTLSYLNLDNDPNSLDFGTLIVYTCKKSCRIHGYAPEYVWKQDYSDKDLVCKK